MVKVKHFKELFPLSRACMLNLLGYFLGERFPLAATFPRKIVTFLPWDRQNYRYSHVIRWTNASVTGDIKISWLSLSFWVATSSVPPAAQHATPVLWSRELVDWWKWDKAALCSRKQRYYRTHTTWETTSCQWLPTACPKMVYSQQCSQLIFDPGWDWHVCSLMFDQMARRVAYWSFVKAIPYFA